MTSSRALLTIRNADDSPIPQKGYSCAMVSLLKKYVLSYPILTAACLALALYNNTHFAAGFKIKYAASQILFQHQTSLRCPPSNMRH